MNRVVLTGLGVVAPNGVGLDQFSKAVQYGKSGLRFFQYLKDANMGCCVAGVPENFDEKILADYLSPGAYKALRSTTVKYSLCATIEAWLNAGLSLHSNNVDKDTGCIFGSGVCDVDHMQHAIGMYDRGDVQKLGTRQIEQLMTSGPASYIGGLFGLGNQVSANSSACSTGTEAVVMAFEKIRKGQAQRMVAGSCEASSQYIWAVFDAMRVLDRNHNDDPSSASRPMSIDSAGFIPGSGAGALILENLEAAQKRNAFIYAEVLSGFVNSGGQRAGGSMTAPSGPGVQSCIETAIDQAGIDSTEIDLVSAHLTGTGADRMEIANWAAALKRSGANFPYINTLKSLTGHCISATGSIECVAAILQMQNNFLQPNKNCEMIQPAILDIIDEKCIVRKPTDVTIDTVIKANFGFGDVNSCVIFRKYKE